MVDSDYAGDSTDTKSTTKFVIRVLGNVFYWKTRKQNNVTKSLTFAEYTALSEMVTEILFVRNMLIDDFGAKIEIPMKNLRG